MSEMHHSPAKPGRSSNLGDLYRAAWRWHFYAGLICLPVIIMLSITGSLYLFKPQVEALLDAPYTGLTRTQQITADDAVTAALAAHPHARLEAYILPRSPGDALQILLATPSGSQRVYVHPDDGRVLDSFTEEYRPMEVIKRIHGELFAGQPGAWVVETVGSWTFVMLATGIYLWWPRGGGRLAGIVYPRLSSGRRLFWRDLHAVTGIWISGFVLILLLTALPWTSVWGGLFKEVRQLGAGKILVQDWAVGAAQPSAQTAEHADHGGHDQHHAMAGIGPSVPLQAIADKVAPLHLPWPVHILRDRDAYVVQSNTQNRPERVTLRFDATTGALVSRTDFSHKPLTDQMVGYGIALHEGQLFGLPNQLLGLATALGLCLLSLSAAIMWWRRRPKGKLGAPPLLSSDRLPRGLFALLTAMALLLPMFTLSLCAIVLVERLILRRHEKLARWLGLRRTAA